MACQMEADSQVDGLRSGLKAHETDLARIRGQRDDLNASLAEKKQREAVRFTQIDEMKALVQSKEKRITTLRSEVWRLQYLLASRSGDEKMMERVKSKMAASDTANESEPDVHYIEALQDRLRSAEEASQDLKRQLDARSSSTSEAELGSKVASLQKELDKVSAILALAATSEEDPNSEDVKSRIIKQSEEVSRLQRELATSQESTTALCDELDKIGEAYSESQKVATTRIVEVARLEDKIMRLTAEKSKADQKYFSAMRNNESIENEVKVSMRNLERQNKVIETFKEMEKSFQLQTQKSEAEIVQLRGLIAKQNNDMLEVQRDAQSIKQREERSTAASISSKEEAMRRTSEYLEESKGRQQIQEQCDKLQRELDKCKKQLAMSGASMGSSKKKGSGGGDDVQVEYLNVSDPSSLFSIFLETMLIALSYCYSLFSDALLARIDIEIESLLDVFTPFVKTVLMLVFKLVNVNVLIVVLALVLVMYRHSTFNSRLTLATTCNLTRNNNKSSSYSINSFMSSHFAARGDKVDLAMTRLRLMRMYRRGEKDLVPCYLIPACSFPLNGNDTAARRIK